MPKLKESREQQKDRIVRAYIAKNMVLYGLTDDQIAVNFTVPKEHSKTK